MSEPPILTARLRVEKSARSVIRDLLIELFARIQDESTFRSATLYVVGAGL